MRNVNKLKDNASHIPLTPAEISNLRLSHAQKNSDLIDKIFNGDGSALEEFTNFGGIQGKVTQVIIRDNN
jgi:hypothetical protein